MSDRRRSQKRRRQVVVIVVRHGERLDYILRDTKNVNWIKEEAPDRPWDPPLTKHGHKQGQALGFALSNILKTNNLPSNIKAIYTSPFLRCRQTSKEIAISYMDQQQQQKERNETSSTATSTATTNNNNNDLKVYVEYGLAESFNENFYRSWSLPNSDSTWGFQKKELPYDKIDITTLHPMSKVPCQTLLEETMKPIVLQDESRNNDDNDNNKDTNDDDSIIIIDVTYQSKSKITTPYSLHPPNFESFKMQRLRMVNTLNLLSESHYNSHCVDEDDETDQAFVMVSHGTYIRSSRKQRCPQCLSFHSLTHTHAHTLTHSLTSILLVSRSISLNQSLTHSFNYRWSSNTFI